MCRARAVLNNLVPFIPNVAGRKRFASGLLSSSGNYSAKGSRPCSGQAATEPFLNGNSSSYAEKTYNAWLEDPKSVHKIFKYPLLQTRCFTTQSTVFEKDNKFLENPSIVNPSTTDLAIDNSNTTPQVKKEEATVDSNTTTQVLFRIGGESRKVDKSGVQDFLTFLEKSYVWVDKSLLISEILKLETDVVLITCPRKWGRSLNLSMLNYFYSNTLSDAEKKKNEDFFKTGTFTTIDDVKVEDVKVEMNAKPLIARDTTFIEKHLHQHPVIYIDFTGMREEDWLISFKRVISDVYAGHNYLLTEWEKILKNDTSPLHEKYDAKQNMEDFLAIYNCKCDEELVKKSVKMLSRWLYEYHGRKTLVFIDEYDRLQYHILLDERVKYDDPPSDGIGFMRDFMEDTFKDCATSCIEKAVLTGILRVATATMLGGLNHVLADYGMIRYGRLAPFYGFSKNEVDLLMEYAGIRSEEAVDGVKRWYGGYKTIDSNDSMFPPWSIMRYCQTGKLSSYWTLSSSLASIGKLLKHSFVYSMLSNVLSSEEPITIRSLELMEIESSVYSNLYKLIRSAPSYVKVDENGTTIHIEPELEGSVYGVQKGIVAILVQTGYLSCKNYDQSSKKVELGVPNREIQKELHTLFLEQLDREYVNKLVQNKNYNAQAK